MLNLINGKLYTENMELAVLPIHSPAEVEWHKRELRRLFESDFRAPDNLAGDGLVTVSIGPRYALMAEILRRMVREVSPEIPLQIWHDGHLLRKDGEKAGWGGPTTYIDIREFPARTFAGAPLSWKSFAILNSGFRRAMFLDCDAYPVAPVAPLFGLLDGPGAPGWILWSADGRRLTTYSEEWTGVKAAPIPPDTNGGQWIVDLSQLWKEMSIIAWIDAHGDYFYSHCIWHDEASSRMVLSEMGTAYRRMRANYWNVMECYDDRGNVAILHRGGAKLWPDCVPKWHPHMLKEQRVIELYRELNGDGYRRAAFAPCAKGRVAVRRRRRRTRACRFSKGAR